MKITHKVYETGNVFKEIIVDALIILTLGLCASIVINGENILISLPTALITFFMGFIFSCVIFETQPNRIIKVKHEVKK
jgi:hypothetical protein